MTSALPAIPGTDSQASRSTDLAQLLDIFIVDDDEPGNVNPPAVRPSERPPCAP